MRKLPFSFQLVEASPWPMTTSISVLNLIISIVWNLNHQTVAGHYLFYLSIISLVISTYFWFYDIIVEGTYQGLQTKKVMENLSFGFNLFLLSEIVIFGSLFFSFFYNSLIPEVQIGSIWPPIGIEKFNYKTIPLLNTAILLFSGITVTASQHYLLSKNQKKSILFLSITIFLGTIFFLLQVYEYFTAQFDISDSVFGSSFFIITGFHAIHMIIGIGFLIVSFILLLRKKYTNQHSLGGTFSALYYHLVDLLWLFVFAIVYCWGQ